MAKRNQTQVAAAATTKLLKDSRTFIKSGDKLGKSIKESFSVYTLDQAVQAVQDLRDQCLNDEKLTIPCKVPTFEKIRSMINYYLAHSDYDFSFNPDKNLTMKSDPITGIVDISPGDFKPAADSDPDSNDDSNDDDSNDDDLNDDDSNDDDDDDSNDDDDLNDDDSNDDDDDDSNDDSDTNHSSGDTGLARPASQVDKGADIAHNASQNAGGNFDDRCYQTEQVMLACGLNAFDLTVWLFQTLQSLPAAQQAIIDKLESIKSPSIEGLQALVEKSTNAKIVKIETEKQSD